MNEESLKKLLRDAVPAEVAQFIEDECAISSLVAFSEFSRKIYYGSNPYGFKSSGQVIRVFRELKKAWQDAIEITFDDRESHYIGVLIKVP